GLRDEGRHRLQEHPGPLIRYFTCRLCSIFWYAGCNCDCALSGDTKTSVIKLLPCWLGTTISRSRSATALPFCCTGEVPVRSTARPCTPFTWTVCGFPFAFNPGFDCSIPCTNC